MMQVIEILGVIPRPCDRGGMGSSFERWLQDRLMIGKPTRP